MADDPVSSVAHGFNMSSLKAKVGGVPLGIWLVLGIGAVAYLLYKRKASTTAAATTDTASTGSGDYSAAGDSAGGGVSANGTDTTTTSSTQTYADNGAWGVAAVNWLVGHGYDATLSNQAINLFLGSQALTTQQQAMVNLAITALGAPPQLVPPVAGGVTSVTKPGVTTPAVPTGLKAGTPTTTSVPLSWSAASGATEYFVYNGATHTANSSGTSHTVTGLKPNTKYTFSVRAVTVSGSTTVASGPSATVSATTAATAKAVTPPKAKPPAKAAPVKAPAKPVSKTAPAAPYTVKAGDNLWNIVKAHYHLTTNASIQAQVNKVYNANRSVIGGNPNLIKPGERLMLPAM